VIYGSDEEELADPSNARGWCGVSVDGRGSVRAGSYHKSKTTLPASILRIFTMFTAWSLVQEPSSA
jgi:hypothetical protein